MQLGRIVCETVSPLSSTDDRQIISRGDARAAGLKWYFTGKPCVNGHVDLRTVGHKKCVQCHRDRMRAVGRANPGKVRARNNAWYAVNQEKARADAVAYRLANKEKVRAADRARNAIPSRIEQKAVSQAAYYRAHLAEMSVSNAAWRAANSENVRVNNLNRRSRLKKAEGRFTATEVKALFAQQQGRCAYDRKQGKPTWCLGGITLKNCHRDHIVAVVNGGTNWISNIQLCCQPCNNKKRSKDPLVFAQQAGFLL